MNLLAVSGVLVPREKGLEMFRFADAVSITGQPDTVCHQFSSNYNACLSSSLDRKVAMRLVKARVTNYRSVIDSGEFTIEQGKTILVGANEGGKSARSFQPFSVFIINSLGSTHSKSL